MDTNRGRLVALVSYNFVIMAASVYVLVNVWPSSTISPQVSRLFGSSVSLDYEVKILWIVIILGALGSLVHSTTSLASYVGNKTFVSSWTAWYILRPAIGASLALIMYFAFRGGLFNPTTTPADINLYGIAAIAGLAGMFSKEATDKLAEVFRTLFQSEEDSKRHNPLAG